jgi:hypothetical protein
MTSLEKPTHCIICTETLGQNDNALACGHWFHLNCVRRHFKPECPLCRRPLNIKVGGTFPQPFIPIAEITQIPIQDVQITYELGDLGYLGDLGDLGDFGEFGESCNFNNFGILDEINDQLGLGNIIFHYDNISDLERDYNYIEERPDYDEENPRGDNWDYEN